MMVYVTDVHFCDCVVFHHPNILQLIYSVDEQFFQQILIVPLCQVNNLGIYQWRNQKCPCSSGAYILVWVGSGGGRLGKAGNK